MALAMPVFRRVRPATALKSTPGRHEAYTLRGDEDAPPRHGHGRPRLRPSDSSGFNTGCGFNLR